MKTINTHSGEIFSPFDAKFENIHLIDVAHALSHMVRANGHFDSFLSIAQHSINCAVEAEKRGHNKRIQLACLLHDASEAYISDITAPVKSNLVDYQKLEKNLQKVIYEKFLGCDLTKEEENMVNKIDHNMLIFEFNSLTTKKIFEKEPDIVSTPNLKFESFEKTKLEFIELHNKLT